MTEICKTRIETIDLLKGLVMVITALFIMFNVVTWYQVK